MTATKRDGRFKLRQDIVYVPKNRHMDYGSFQRYLGDGKHALVLLQRAGYKRVLLEDLFLPGDGKVTPAAVLAHAVRVIRAADPQILDFEIRDMLQKILGPKKEAQLNLF